MKYFALVFLLLIEACCGSRILGLFSHPGYSHFKVFHPIMKGLAEAGHHVTVISYFPDEKPHENYKDYKFEGEDFPVNFFSLEGFSRRKFIDNFVEFFELAAWGKMSCESALKSSAIDEVLKIHKHTPYDLVITEFFDTDCLLGVVHKMQIPFVGLSSCALMPWHYDRVGIPDTPSYIPSEFVGFSEKMNFWERLQNWIVTKTVKLMYKLVEIEDNRMLKEKFGDGIPDVRDIAKNSSLILVNQHHSLSGPRPLTPSVVEVGGLHILEPKPLPKDVQEILDSAKHGVIFISWGSLLKADTLPEFKRKSMISALKKLKETVLWKWENETMIDKPDNVVIKKWVPQKDILCHPNVKAFMSHGGLLGVSEATYCGVPTIVTPIYGDQFLNAAALEHRGMGVIMNYHEIEENSVSMAIKEVLTEEKRENARKISYSYKNREETPLKTAIWWIEYVIETKGGSLLRTYAVEVPWYIYHSLDVMGALFGVVLTIIFILYVVITKICMKIKKKKEKKLKKN